MNKVEFVEILKMAMEYYSPYTQNHEDESFMCYAVEELENTGRITSQQAVEAEVTIFGIISPHTSLWSYLLYEEGLRPSGKTLLRFWEDVIDEEGAG